MGGYCLKTVLVYPCGTEIGLEIYRALQYAKNYRLIGGSSSYDHGRFVYKEHIDNLPFITDSSNERQINEFNDKIAGYGVDFIYPAMDSVVYAFSKHRNLLKPVLIAANYDVASITRSKYKTYGFFSDCIPVPSLYRSKSDVEKFPVFIKPDYGQGSAGARLVHASDELSEIDFDSYLCMEYLPGEEYTVDCFTNQDGKLLYSKARSRSRIRNGISVNALFVENQQLVEYANIINERIDQVGGWFFQMKEDSHGRLKLLEIASRIAGSSSISRNIGANLPLMTVDLFNGIKINDVTLNDQTNLELDRALANAFRFDLFFDTVYMDFDDTLTIRGKVNDNVVKFIFQCRNKGKNIILISKHDGDLEGELKRLRIYQIFDEIKHIDKGGDKSDYIKKSQAIFIDDSYVERKKVKQNCGIPVFDTHMLECLMEN